jgi:hypothetical protein
MTPHVGVFPFLILGSFRQTAQGGEALGEFVALFDHFPYSTVLRQRFRRNREANLTHLLKFQRLT